MTELIKNDYHPELCDADEQIMAEYLDPLMIRVMVVWYLKSIGDYAGAMHQQMLVFG